MLLKLCYGYDDQMYKIIIYMYNYIIYIVTGAHNDESVRVGAVNDHAFN